MGRGILVPRGNSHAAYHRDSEGTRATSGCLDGLEGVRLSFHGCLRQERRLLPPTWPALLWVSLEMCPHTQFGKHTHTAHTKGVSFPETYTARTLACWEVCPRPDGNVTLVISVTIGYPVFFSPQRSLELCM